MPSTYDQYTQKSKERQDFVNSIPTQRDAGISKLKTDQGYDDKRAAVESATKTLYETQKRLDALPKQVQQRTAGRPVTQAQLDRITNAESQPLSEQYRSAGLGREQASQGLSAIEQAVRDYTQGFNQDAQLKYQDLASSSQGLFDLWREENNRNFQKEMADMDRKAQKDLAKQQADDAIRLQQIIANLNRPKPTPTPTTTTNNEDLVIEVPDTPSAGQTINSVGNAAKGIFDFWGNVGNRANQRKAGLNIGGVDLGMAKSVFDDTLGRIFNNRETWQEKY